MDGEFRSEDYLRAVWERDTDRLPAMSADDVQCLEAYRLLWGRHLSAQKSMRGRLWMIVLRFVLDPYKSACRRRRAEIYVRERSRAGWLWRFLRRVRLVKSERVVRETDAELMSLKRALCRAKRDMSVLYESMESTVASDVAAGTLAEQDEWVGRVCGRLFDAGGEEEKA